LALIPLTRDFHKERNIEKLKILRKLVFVYAWLLQELFDHSGLCKKVFLIFPLQGYLSIIHQRLPLLDGKLTSSPLFVSLIL